jgi:ADP-ribose pyrophosphatase YjhB (NUDIX family)
MDIHGFNIRVYGLLIDEGRILVTDEFRMGMKMTKFPGGGLKYGEGTIDCLKRECREELGQEIEVKEHFYTTDFFQPTMLLPVQMQLISIYYHISAAGPYRFKTSEKAFDFEELTEGAQSFRWISMEDIQDNDVTLPVDQKVVELLKEKFV